MIKRTLNFKKILERKSLFLLGPRQTGKSTYLKSEFPKALSINLLKTTEYKKYIDNANILHEVVEHFAKEQKESIVIIDEIQKIPSLLDDVHDLIEKHKNLRFILTGSSARKLKRGHANMLGGRASHFNLHPICFAELGLKQKKDWWKFCETGSLPSIFLSKDPWADLQDYVSLYLKEEIQAEGLSRSVENFSRFLYFAACTNAEQVNYANLGQDASLSPSTVRDYYQILSDTLIGFTLPAFLQTQKRKALATEKFYYFDCGVSNILLKRKSLSKGTPEYGKSFEQAIFLELKAFLDYNQLNYNLEFWRSTSKFEVDFLVYSNLRDITAIEVKAGTNPSRKDYKGLFAFEEDFPLKRKIVVCDCTEPRMTSDGVEILPALYFLEKLWAGQII